MDPIGLVVLAIYAILLRGATHHATQAPSPRPGSMVVVFPEAWSTDDARRAFLRDPEAMVRCKKRREDGGLDEVVVDHFGGAVTFFDGSG